MMFTLAHLSDLHATPVRTQKVGALLNKRALGWLSWALRRSKEYRPEVLNTLLADLQAEQPDHVVVTGDLTNIGLEEEFRAAAVWLRRLGDRQAVSIIPGNHDAYVKMPRASSWAYWEEYLQSDTPGDVTPPSMLLPGNTPHAEFPTVRMRGPIAVVGVCSAHPTGVFRASGTVGAYQLDRLDCILRRLAATAVCRVVLIHHPPTDEELAPRRRLTDAAAFRAVLARAGAELVLHGHTHRTTLTRLPGPIGPIPVVGVRSASAIGHRPGRKAQYHLYRIEGREQERGFTITMTTREYDAQGGCFRHRGDRLLSQGMAQPDVQSQRYFC